MKRTQIYIDEKTYAYLNKESRAQGKSMSEIIRESIREKMNKKTNQILISLEEISGIWKERDFNVDRYIRTARKNRKL
jgi:negative regulator of replication initiation